jgi:hypothetical protein
MGKGSRAYKSAKRGKELARQRKKEEKMRRRLAKKDSPVDENQEETGTGSEETAPADSPQD